VGANLTIGVGAAVAGGLGAPAGVTNAFGTAGRMMGPISTVVLGRRALQGASMLPKYKLPKKKRR